MAAVVSASSRRADPAAGEQLQETGCHLLQLKETGAREVSSPEILMHGGLVWCSLARFAPEMLSEIAKEGSKEKERERAIKSSFSGVEALIEHYDY